MGCAEVPADYARLCARRLPLSFDSEEKILDYFAQCGTVRRCFLLPLRRNDESRQAYLSFWRHQEAQNALDTLNKQNVDGTVILLDWDFDKVEQHLADRAGRKHNPEVHTNGSPSGMRSQQSADSGVQTEEEDSLVVYIGRRPVGSMDIDALQDAINRQREWPAPAGRPRFGPQPRRLVFDASPDWARTPHKPNNLPLREGDKPKNAAIGRAYIPDDVEPDAGVPSAALTAAVAPFPPKAPSAAAVSPPPPAFKRANALRNVHAIGPVSAQHAEHNGHLTTPPRPVIRPARTLTAQTMWTQGHMSAFSNGRAFLAQPVFLETEEPVGRFWVGEQEWTGAPEAVRRIGQSLTDFYGKATLQKEFRPTRVDEPVAVFIAELPSRPELARMWHRGVVVEIQPIQPDGEVVFVELVDVGMDVAVDKMGDIQPLDLQFAEEVPQVLRALIGGIALDSYTSRVYACLEEVLRANAPRMTALLEEGRPFPVVRLFDAGWAVPVDISCVVVQKLQTVQPYGGAVQIGVPVYVSMIEGDDYDLLLCDVDSMDELQAMEEKIAQLLKSSQPSPADCGPNAINAVYVPKQQRYCRCFLLDTTPDPKQDVRVELLDRGGVESVSLEQIAALPEALQNDSPVMMCRLFGLLGLSTESRADIKEELRGLVEQACAYRVVLEEKNDIAEVVLWSVKTMLPLGSGLVEMGLNGHSGRSGEPEGPVHISELEYPKTLQPGLVVDVVPTFVLEGEICTAVLDTSLYTDTTFTAMQESLQKSCDAGAPLDEMPKTGTVVCARFSLDNAWYRAAIEKLKESSTQARVIFLDYGNREWVNLAGMRPLERQWVRVPRGTVTLCDGSYMPAVDEEWSGEDVERIGEILVGKSCRFELGPWDSERDVWVGRMKVVKQGQYQYLLDELLHLRLAERSGCRAR